MYVTSVLLCFLQTFNQRWFFDSAVNISSKIAAQFAADTLCGAALALAIEVLHANEGD
jgi:hypothetical protein